MTKPRKQKSLGQILYEANEPDYPWATAAPWIKKENERRARAVENAVKRRMKKR